MLKVGLTGGIGSGKSTAARRFEELGVPIVDADVIARNVVEPGKPALEEVIAAFGKKVVNSDGELDRIELRKIVFENIEHKALLESILHPRIYDEILRQLDHLSAPYCIVVIPLLAESKRIYPLDRVLVIDLPHTLQLERTSARDQQSKEKINKIIQSQSSRDKRLSLADDIIENSSAVESLHEKIDLLHQKYTELAQQFESTAPER